jgi:hypothetical protein
MHSARSFIFLKTLWYGVISFITVMLICTVLSVVSYPDLTFQQAFWVSITLTSLSCLHVFWEETHGLRHEIEDSQIQRRDL